MNLRWMRRMFGLPLRKDQRNGDKEQKEWIEARQREIRERIKILGLDAELARRKNRGASR